MDDIITYKSIFDPTVRVIVLFKDNKMYGEVKPLFDTYGYGFVSPSDNLVILDGEIFSSEDEIDEDILRFIEAHEISHILLGHTTERNDNDEMDADLGAYILLKKLKFTNSMEILVDNFEERHNTEFKKTLLSRVSDKIF
jgi:hypothetical protein